MHGRLDNENKTFQNGKQLLESCIGRLNEQQHAKAGGTVALYPTVLILLGAKSRNHTKDIKSTLDQNWNNARCLQYINVIKTEEGWQCFRLQEQRNPDTKTQQQRNPDIEKQQQRNLEKEEQEQRNPDIEKQQRQNQALQTQEVFAWDGYVWESAGDGWTETLNHAIVDMLETEEKIFSRRTMIKMEYVLDASEADGMQYADLFLQTSNALQSDEQKTLYLMLDQRPGADRVDASDALLRYLVAKSGDAELSTTIYLLSNYLQSGQMLGDNRIWQNYRLAADLMLLTGSRTEADTVVCRQSGGFKTVSYALVTKPTDEIAAVSLRTLMQEIYENGRERLFRELSASEIAGKLQMDRYHGFSFLEELFQKNIRVKFPKETDWKYLPFAGVSEYRRFLKSQNLTIDAADTMTYGAATAFLHRQYLAPVTDFLSNEKEMRLCRQRISQLLCGQFTYFELLYLQEHEDELNDVIAAEYHSAGLRSGGGVCGRLHEQGIYESRRIFYKKMKPVIVTEMHQLIQQALAFRQTYEACTREVQKECMTTGDESESVEKFYSGIAAEYAGRAVLPDIFCVTDKKEDLLQAFWNVYLNLIREHVYDCDFEQEMDCRMDGMDEKQRHVFVEKELRKKLEGSRRLKNTIEIPMTEAGCYYMVNANADYAKALERAGRGEYVLFHLNRTDCIEQLKIYDILKPAQLWLGGVKNRDDHATKNS